MSQFEKINEKSRKCSHYYETKTMIKLLLLIDELHEKGYQFTYYLRDDVKKYGEEVVFSKDDHKKKMEEFLHLENDLNCLIKQQEYQIKDLIENLSELLNFINKQGESS